MWCTYWARSCKQNVPELSTMGDSRGTPWLRWLLPLASSLEAEGHCPGADCCCQRPGQALAVAEHEQESYLGVHL